MHFDSYDKKVAWNYHKERKLKLKTSLHEVQLINFFGDIQEGVVKNTKVIILLRSQQTSILTVKTRNDTILLSMLHRRLQMFRSTLCSSIATGFLTLFHRPWWDPVCTFPWRNMLDIHSIDLLQCLSLSLNEEKIHDNRGSEIAACKDIAVSEIDGICDKWSEESN